MLPRKIYYKLGWAIPSVTAVNIDDHFDFSSKEDLCELAEICAFHHYSEFGAWSGARTFEIYAAWGTPPLAIYHIEAVAPVFSVKELK